MGLRDKYAKKIEEQGFRPIDLNEANVLAIFNRCLAKEGSKEIASSILYFPALGYTTAESIEISFDKATLLKNKKNIEYLYGQFNAVHTGKHKTERFTIEQFAENYNGNRWTESKSVLLQLLYLGGGKEINIVAPFFKKLNDTTLLSQELKPTLSPKDPAFPAWWEAHKGEWEK